MDPDTLQDLLDVVTAAVGVGTVARGTRAGFQVTRIGRMAAVSSMSRRMSRGSSSSGPGSSSSCVKRSTPGLTEGERRSRRMVALGGALMGAGMQAGMQLITRAYAPRPITRTPEAAVGPSTTTPPEPVGPAPVTKEARPAPAPEPARPAPAAEPAAPTHAPYPAGPATVPEPPAPAPSPMSIDDLLLPSGRLRPEFPELRAAWEAYAEQARSQSRGPRDRSPARVGAAPNPWGARCPTLNALLPAGWRRVQRAVYPAARPDAVSLPVAAPAPGSRVEGTGLRWQHRLVRTEELPAAHGRVRGTVLVVSRTAAGRGAYPAQWVALLDRPGHRRHR